MKRFILLLCSLWLMSHSFNAKAATNWTPQTIPNPIKTAQSFIADPDHFLSEEDKAAFNKLAYYLDDSANIQMAVVMVNSISDEYSSFDFGVEVFNNWKIGHDNRGILLMIVMDSHDWFFHTGYGIEETLTDALSKRIGEKHLVPNFQNGDYGKGIIEATEALTELFLSNANASSVSKKSIVPDWNILKRYSWIGYIILAIFGLLILFVEQPKQRTSTDTFDITFIDAQFAQLKPKKKSYRSTLYDKRISLFTELSLLPILIPLAVSGEFFSTSPLSNFFIGLYLYLNTTSIISQYRISRSAAKKSRNSVEHYFRLQQGNQYLTARILIQPLIFIPYYVIYKNRLESLKDKSCVCPFCGEKAHQAPKVVRLQHTTVIKEKEQQLRTMDYRYLTCPQGHHIEIDYPGEKRAQYQVCPHCGAIAVVSEGPHIVSAPTTFKTGLQEETFTCLQCHYQQIKSRILPKLAVIASTMGRGGGSFGGGSLGGSSFGGRSFGGGFTGGGGGGGKW